MPANTHALWLQSAAKEYVQLTTAVDIRNLDAFSFEAWIKVGPNSTQPNQSAFTIQQGGTHKRLRFACTPYAGRLRFEFARADGTADTNYTHAVTWDDRWHHVAFTADLGDAAYVIYYDGSAVQTGTLVGAGKDAENNPLKISDTATQRSYIGAWSTAIGGGYWDGKIDCIRLWKSAISANQVQTGMRDFLDVEATNNLLAEWRLDSTGTSTTTAVKHSTTTGTWTGTLTRNGVAVTNLYTIDRPFLGDGDEDVTPPSVPTVLAPTNITDSSFDIAWTSSTDNVYVQGYEVTVSTLDDFSAPFGRYAALQVGLATSAQITGLDPGANHYVRVRAFDANGNASDYATRAGNPAITTLATGDLTIPGAPTLSAATAITPSSFAISWTAATDNVGVAGYKLDVAKDASFRTFVPFYRNLDVGLVTSTNVINQIDPDTTYYVRVRAYDAAENESVDSGTVRVTTEALPDLIPPDPVVVLPPTSVAGEEFVARWEASRDNVGIAGYLLDVATDEAFLRPHPGYVGLDVGDVRAARVAPTAFATTYFYRVRAYDAAGNISAYADHVEQAVTLPRSQVTGGPYEVGVYPSQQRTLRSDTATARGTATIALQSYPLYQELTALPAFYPLNDRAGADAVHNHTAALPTSTPTPPEDGRVTGTVTFGRPGPVSADPDSLAARAGATGTIAFDPTQLRLDGNVTLGLFFKADDATQNGSLFTVRSDYVNAVTDHLYFDIVAANGTVAVAAQYITGGVLTDYQTAPLSAAYGAWHFLAIRYDASTRVLRTYLNGSLAETTTLARALPALGALTNPVVEIGTTAATPFGGDLANLVYAPSLLPESWVSTVQTARGNVTPVSATTRYALKGEIQSAGAGAKTGVALSVFAYDTGSSVRVHRITNAFWDETVASGSVTLSTEFVTATLAGGWQEIDVTSLYQGTTELALAVIPAPGSTNPVTIGGSGDRAGHDPYFVVEVDPTTAIEPQDLTATATTVTVTNYLINGGAENGVGGSTGITAAGTGASVTTETVTPYAGSTSARLDIAAGSGERSLTFASPVAMTVGAGARTLLAQVALKGATDFYPITVLRVEGTYTDNTTFTQTWAGAITLHADWTVFRFPPITTLSTRTLKSARIVVGDASGAARVLWADAAAVVDVTGTIETAVPVFDGASEHAEWQGLPYQSTSTLSLPRVQADLTYVGDNNDNSGASFASRLATADAWTPSTGTTTVDRALNTFTHLYRTCLAGANLVPNPSFEGMTADGWTTTGPVTVSFPVGVETTEEQAWVGARALKVTLSGKRLLGVRTQRIRVAASTTYQLRLALHAPAQQRLALTWQAFTSTGAAAGTGTTAITGTGDWAEITTSLTTGAGADSLILAVTGDEPRDADNAGVFYLDGVQLQQGSLWLTPYLDGSLPGAAWDGDPHRSSTTAVFVYDTAYAFQATVTDVDGINGTASVGTGATIPLPPDNALHTQGLTAAATATTLDLTIPYTGDDNATGTVTVEFKRHDLSTYTRASARFDRSAKMVRSTIPNLRAGTAYDVKVTFADPVNVVYGENPIVRVVNTGVEGVGDLSDPSITFGGFVLNNPRSTNVAVLEHDAFSHPERTTRIEKLPRLDGEIEQQSYWGKKVVTMTGVISGKTRQELADTFRAFTAAMARPKQPLVIDTLDARGTYMTATVTSLTTSERGGVNIRHLVWNAEFTCADPFRYSTTETTEKDIQFHHGEAVVLTNTGDVPCDVVYTITTLFTNSSLTVGLVNSTTGVRIAPKVTITRGDRLEIDTARLRVVKNGVEVDFDGGFPRLAVGGNTLTMLITPATRSDGSSYTVALATRRRHRFL